MPFSRITRRDALKTGAGLLAVGVAASQRLASAQSTPAAGTPAVPGVKLTVYSGQHEDLTKAFADAFKMASGIEIEVRAGSDSDLANQIVEEGDKTNADVFITEEPGPVGLLDAHDLLAPIDPAALAKTDKRFNPENGHWLAYGARSRAIFYNPTLIAETALPKSIMDLTGADWKGKFGYAPSGAFVDTVTYLVNTIGEDATLDWLTGIEANGKNLLKNGAVRDSVEAGQNLRFSVVPKGTLAARQPS
jgi:iron(III) transport system substrate-binding protein